MVKTRYLYYQCENPDCGLRFPGREDSLPEGRCPRCWSRVRKVASLDITQETSSQPDVFPGLWLEGLLDNIRSAWNVGSIFRTADGTGIRHLYLCGFTPTPQQPQVGKTALGAEETTPWSYLSNGVSATMLLKERGYQIWALEDTPEAETIFNLRMDLPDKPVVLIVGNEVCGVDPGILEQCDRILSIPMMGIKRSYNVAVAFGIATSYLRYCQIFSQGSAKKLPNT
jgi:23S rRNA (guanosine2251-2'-O)-methyltransferase